MGLASIKSRLANRTDSVNRPFLAPHFGTSYRSQPVSEALPIDPVERRKAVCKALTRVVRGAELSQPIDPKAFFMMLNANYAVLYRDEGFDLTPLWEALAGQHDAAVLTGLFIKFAETLQSYGLTVTLPPQVAGLTPEQQQMHLAALDANPAAQQEAEVVPLTDELEGLTDEINAIAPLPLSTDDLRPMVGAEQKREIVQAIVASIKATPLSSLVDGSQLAFLVDNNFDNLCDGSTFNIEPVFQGLRDLGNVADRDLYLASVLFSEALRPHQMTLNHQRLDVSEAEGRQLIEAHHRAVKQAKRDAMLAVTHTIDTPPQKPPPPAEMPRAEARRSQLRRMGLGQTDRTFVQRVRLAVLAVGLVGVAIPAYVYRSSRPLSIQPYAQSIPLKSAELLSGAFLGRLNESAWWPLPIEERAERLKAFETLIRSQGLAPDLQVRDEKNRLVIAGVGNGRIRGAPMLMRGRPDGSLIEPPDYSNVDEKTEAVPSGKEQDSPTTEDSPPAEEPPAQQEASDSSQ